MVEHDFVFIGGVHRSGTTILADCIGDHPEVSGLSDTGVPMNEGQFLQNVYAPAGTKRKLWPIRYLSPILPTSFKTRGYGGPGRFGFDPGSHLTENSPLVSPANAQSITRAWKPYWELDRRVLLEKSPPNLLRTRFLQALFPRSAFIILLRHPIPVSYATRRWTGLRPLYYLLKHWQVCYNRFRNDQPHLDRVLVLYYEDFVENPQSTMERIFTFLELPTAPVQRDISPNVNGRYFRQWNEATQASKMRRRYHELLRDAFEEGFNQFGYTLGNPFLEETSSGRIPGASFPSTVEGT